jgi:rubrerythrin
MQLESTLTSTLTCPSCGFQATETMPTNACPAAYTCLRAPLHHEVFVIAPR